MSRSCVRGFRKEVFKGHSPKPVDMELSRRLLVVGKKVDINCESDMSLLLALHTYRPIPMNMNVSDCALTLSLPGERSNSAGSSERKCYAFTQATALGG